MHIVHDIPRDPIAEAQDAEREADRWRRVARMAQTDEGQIRAESFAIAAQNRARRFLAQVAEKAGQP